LACFVGHQHALSRKQTYFTCKQACLTMLSYLFAPFSLEKIHFYCYRDILDVEQCIRKCRHWIYEQDNNLAVPPDLDTSLSNIASSSSHPSRPRRCSGSLDLLADPAGASTISLPRATSAGANKATSHTAQQSGTPSGPTGSGGLSRSTPAAVAGSANDRFGGPGPEPAPLHKPSLLQQLTSQLFVAPAAVQGYSQVSGSPSTLCSSSSNTGRATGRTSRSTAPVASSITLGNGAYPRCFKLSHQVLFDSPVPCLMDLLQVIEARCEKHVVHLEFVYPPQRTKSSQIEGVMRRDASKGGKKWV
jgi:hypothetical protein